MAILQILPFGESVLRKKAKPIETVTPKLAKLLDDMAETLYSAEGRAGLAAPQVGILRQAVVMDCGDGLIELINPTIIEARGEQEGAEACLSYPGYFGVVKRASYVRVKYNDRGGAEKLLEGEDFLARCLQHEIDHLSGVLFVDHVRDPWLYEEGTKRKIDLLQAIRLTNKGL